ncbi:LLM class flavin-dependent oxidoreductase [Microbacterium album]|uniref:Luciferase-like domain-containing protein n=1 Tax=Microbacterium album TaxID=2053191 RepID=A0A917IG54_9MICO|nr:LLM class flavin-dependent oxidoreductase [Microbacterium album]GGH42996.1 hypothetical protein GCM10010921_16580 [Microbacterium album]
MTPAPPGSASDSPRSAPIRLGLALAAPAVLALATSGRLPELRDALDGGGFLRIARADEPGIAPAAFDLLDDEALRGRALTPEPLTIASYASGFLPGIPLLADADILREHPYNLARRIGSLDHMTGGRSGVVVREPHDGPDAARAAEALWLVQQLLRTWPLESVTTDRDAPAIADVERIWAPAHDGRYRVAGPLTTPSSPQGLPVFVRAHAEPTHTGEALHDLVIDAGSTLQLDVDDVAVSAWRAGDDVRAIELRPLADDPREALRRWREARRAVAAATAPLADGETLRAALGLSERALVRPAQAHPAFASASGKDLF